MTDKTKDSLRFVTRFYSPGALHPDTSFIRKGLPFWKRHAVPASIIGTTLLAAAAVSTYLALNLTHPQTAEPVKKNETTVFSASSIPTSGEVKKMKFEDASLHDVVKEIEKEYGVKVTGETEGQPRLSLSYEGTAEDLVAAINDLLGTNLSIEK